jgi:hypothetical protein
MEARGGMSVAREQQGLSQVARKDPRTKNQAQPSKKQVRKGKRKGGQDEAGKTENEVWTSRN